MAACSATRRAGMTLVELLVVVAIVGLLAVTVLPTLATTTEGRRTRETTRMITSFIAQRQAKALGHPTGAGFGLIKTGTFIENPAIDLVPAVIPDAYRGDTPTASVTLTAPAMTLSFTGAFSVGGLVSCTTGDLIRFDGRGAWYSLNTTVTATACALRSTANVDALAGQTAMNTPWPAFSGSHAFEILRSPQRAGGAVSIGEGRCIDIYWSYAGTLRLVGNFPSLFFIYDAAGRVRQVAAGANRFSPDGPILLLVGRVDRAGQPYAPLSNSDDSVGANWQYADSEWVAIDLMSGVTKSAACAAAAAAKQPPDPNWTAEQIISWRVRESKNFIRSAFATGGS
jgi:prepilin-type N-terminal cleavage/methylation domain-containing protein